MKPAVVFILPFLLLPIAPGMTLANPQGDSPAPLGRLFFTPEGRAQLERQRQFDIKQTRTLENGTLRLDGIVTRSSGKTTVWVNNRAQHENNADPDVAVVTSRRQPGSARLLTNEDASTELKVGATLDRATQETSGGLTHGEIRVRQPGGSR